MLIYILKSSACLGIFFLFYKLFLEKENMHVFKRFYLLVSVIIAFAIPLITFTQYIESTGNFVVDNLTQVNIISEQIQDPFPYLSVILWSIYAIGTIFFSIKFTYNLSKLIYKINNNPKHRYRNFTNVLLPDLTIPHTFFNYIFLNKQKFEAQLIPKEVLLHEETHANQKHSVDIILIEILQVVFWFNPLIYYMKHAMKLNHEFLADQAVINHGINTSKYQNILLKFSLSNAQPQLANAINYSFIQKRFTIMKTHTSKNTIWLRSLVLLPLLAVLLYGFSNKVTIEKEVPNSKVINEITLQKKATKEQIAEYNALAKKYNEHLNSKSDLRIKLKDVKRLEYIYSLMTQSQKKLAEPFPDFPPPPPIPDVPSIKETTDVRPPQYSKPRRVYKDQKPDDVPQLPLRKDVIYFINGKKASLEQVKELSVDDVTKVDVVKKKGAEKSEIYITTKQ